MKKNTIKEPKISKKVIDYLEKNKYKYEIIKHRTTYTAWDTAQTEKVKPQEVVKTLVMKADKEYVLALLPSDRNMDKKKLLADINKNKANFAKENKIKENKVKKIGFADEKWLKNNIKIGKLGAIPPFGDIIKLEMYVDDMVLKNKKIYLSSGDYTASIRILVSQFVKNESFKKGKFSLKKPKK